DITYPLRSLATAPFTMRPSGSCHGVDDHVEVLGTELLMVRHADATFNAKHLGHPRAGAPGEQRPTLDAMPRKTFPESTRICRAYREDGRRRSSGKLRPAIRDQIAEARHQGLKVRPPPFGVRAVSEDRQQSHG